MFRVRSWGLLSVASAAMFLGACSSSPMSRIDSNRAEYESWPIDVRQAVLEGRVLKDMTYEQVEMAVGKPATKTVRNTRNATEEIWIYSKGGGGPNLGGLTIGGGVGGVGVVSQPGGGGAVGDENEVVFVNGRVVRTTFPQ